MFLHQTELGQNRLVQNGFFILLCLVVEAVGLGQEMRLELEGLAAAVAEAQVFQ